MQKTNIEWTDATWNPIRRCSRVSEGCRNCYAEKVAYRFSGPGKPYEGLAVLKNGHVSWTGKVELVEKHLLDPLKWRAVRQYDADDGERYADRPRRIFVNSMSDLFHENVPDEWIDRIFAVMALCPQHTFQILTKRPERMRQYLTSHGRTSQVYNVAVRIINSDFDQMPTQMAHHRSSGDGWWPLPNVWPGVSVENQETADERGPFIKQLAEAGWLTFFSCEPLLGDLDIRPYLAATDIVREHGSTGKVVSRQRAGARWVIVGGESGPGARPMHPDWARSLRDQCQAACVPFFYKQTGAWIPGEQLMLPNRGKIETATWFDNRWLYDVEYLSHTEGHRDDEPDLYLVGKKSAGALLDGREWREFPEARQ